VLLLLLGTAESVQFLMLLEQHFGAFPSILLLWPTFNRNTQEKHAIIGKKSINLGKLAKNVEYFARFDCSDFGPR
jgi:hypothetical protein